MTGTIFRIARFSVHDGPGIRTTVFLKGCPLRCRWCHSPESQRPGPQLALHEDRCLVCGTCLPECPEHAIVQEDDGYVTDFSRCRACGACVARCPSGARELVGREVSADEVLREIERDILFFDQSGGGATFSGGEPFMQPDFLEVLLRGCRERGIRTAVDTCGVAAPATFARLEPLADLFLFDVKVVDETRHRDLTGASNASVLANLGRLAATPERLRVRVPLVPGLTDDPDNLAGVGALLRSLGIDRLDLLPYHRTGIAKYARLGTTYDLGDVRPPAEADVARAVATLTSAGLQVHVGG